MNQDFKFKSSEVNSNKSTQALQQSNSQLPPNPNQYKQPQYQIKINESQQNIQRDRQSGTIQEQTRNENDSNSLIQSQGRLNNSLGQKNFNNLSPNFPKEILCEEDRFTFDKMEKELQNRDKVDSYHSATFRKGSELLQNQINQQGSLTNSQNDISLNNSQAINGSQIGGRQVYKRRSTGKQSIDMTNQSQLQNQSQISQPYLKINNRVITAKQFMQTIKETISQDYDDKLLGLFKFAQLYSSAELKGANVNQLMSDAAFLYDNKFKGITPSKQYNFKQYFDEYYHDISKKFLYQKPSGFGRVAERQACICEGKIKQPIPDKNKSNQFPYFKNILLYLNRQFFDCLFGYYLTLHLNITTKLIPYFSKNYQNPFLFKESSDYSNSILQPYKEKVISNVIKRIEERGSINNFRQLKWVSNPQKKYRILYQDSNKNYFAVYTDTKQEAQKLKDYSICFSLDEQIKSLNPIGIFKYATVIFQRIRVVSLVTQVISKLKNLLNFFKQFKEKLKMYAEFLESQKNKAIAEVSMEESPYQRYISNPNKNSNSIGQEKKFELIQLEALENDELQDSIQDQEQEKVAQLISDTTNRVSSNKDVVRTKQTHESNKLEQMQSNKSIPSNQQIIKQLEDSEKIQQLIGQQQNNTEQSAGKDMILEEEEENNNKNTQVNESIGNKRNSGISIQTQLQNQNLIFNNNGAQNNKSLIQQQSVGQQQNQTRPNNIPPHISKWDNRQSSLIRTFQSNYISSNSLQNAQGNKYSQFNLIKEYDLVFMRSLGEQLKFNLRKIADQEINYIKQRVQQMKEAADTPVDIFLTFHQLQFEFKNEKDQLDMILKPKLRLQISEENEYKQQIVQFVVELKSRVYSKLGKVKEFELYGEQKVAAIQNVKLVKMKRNEIKIEVIDEITDSIIARNSIKMEKILSQTEFMNLQLTIEPVQLLSEKLIIQVHLQSFIQSAEQKKQYENDHQDDEDYNQNDQRIPGEVPHSISEYLERILLKQNFIIDNFYQSRVFLDHFTPSQFKILLDIISNKGINTTPLQLSLRKQSNKLDCYQQIRVCLFKYYIEKQSSHQSLLAKNLSGWNQLYDEIVSQSDHVEYSNNQTLGNNYLDTSDGFILRDAVDEMRNNDEYGADQYLQEMQSQRGSLTQSQMQNSTSRRIVTSIFYKRDLWELDPSQYSFYEKIVQLTKKGIPNPLRQTLWLELGKANKYAFIIDELLRTYYFDLPPDNLQNKKSYAYKNLLKKSYQVSMENSQQNQISEMQIDIDWYRNNVVYINDQMLSNLTNIFYAFCHYVELQGAKVIYSRYLIPLAAKAIEYFKSESEENDSTLEENVFWLVVCFTNNYAKRYYNTQQMMETAHQVQQQQQQNTQSTNNPNVSTILNKTLVQSQISTLPANNPPQSNQPRVLNRLNYIPDDIRLDMLVFEYYLKEKNEKLFNYFQNISFSIGIYFAERMLCFFSDLFNHELLFRIWDYLFVEGSSKNSLKATYFGIAVMIYFLNKNANNLMNICKSKKEAQLYLSLAAKFEVDCDLFIQDSIAIYNNFVNNEPTKFRSNSSQQQPQQQNAASTLAKTTKKIFDSIINVSKNFFNQTLQKHLEVIDQSYSQLDMQRYLNQMMFIQNLVSAKDGDSRKIDLNILVKTIEELERDLVKRSQNQYLSNQSQFSTQNQVKASDRSFQELPRTLTPPQGGEFNTNGRARSTSQISVVSQNNKQINQQNNKGDGLKPIYNIYTKPAVVQKVFIYLHQIQMVEDYNELTIKITLGNITKAFQVKKVSSTQIIECFDLSSQSKFFGSKPTFGIQSQYQNTLAGTNGLNSNSGDLNKMVIEIYENINNISHPLKHTFIDLKNYQVDVISKDYTLLYDLDEIDDPLNTMIAGNINNANSNLFNQQILNNNSNLNQNRLNTQGNNENDISDQNKGNNQLKTNYSSGIEYSLLLATSHGLGESESYQNIINNKKLSISSNFSILGNSTNNPPPQQNSTAHLMDKFNFVPEAMQIRKNSQIESKLKSFNQMKAQNQVEIIQNRSLNSLKNLWKQRTSLSIDEFRIFAESTGLKVWHELNLQEVFNHFSYEGRICLFDLLVACILQVEGRYPQKVDLIRKLFQISSPILNNQEESNQGEGKLKQNINCDNPYIYLSFISEIYCKNMLYLPLDQHFNFLKLNNMPHISKAKYFFDYYSIPTQTSIQTSQIQPSISSRSQYGAVNDSACNFGATQSRLSHSLDLTVFMQSFCGQQLQFKGTLDFYIDSQEFINSLRIYLRQQHNIDNPPGKLQVFYWSKGQLRQLQAQYGYQTLGLANLNYIKVQKTKIGRLEQTAQIQQSQNSQNKIQSVLKLLEFNDTLVNLNYDSYQMKEEEVNNTFTSLPLLSYFNSLQNSLYSQLNKKTQNLQTFQKSKQTVYLNINIDNISRGSFKLISQPDNQEMQALLEEVNYQNKKFKTIQEDWSVLKNVSLPKQSQVNEIEQDTKKVIDMKIDHIPLWMKVEDLSKLFIYRIMENCIHKIEQFSYKQKESFWIRFFSQIKNINLFSTLESVSFLDQQVQHQLDCDLNIQQNLTKRLNISKRVEDLDNVCIILKFKTNYVRPQQLSYFEQPQQYAIFHFKDGGKQWLPCKIIGCVFDQSSTHLFLVEFVDFQRYIFKRTESEISVDQDIQIQQLSYEDIELIQNDNKNYQIIDDRSINYNIETQYWDQSQYNGQNLNNTRMNTSHINVLNTSFNNIYDQSKTKPTQMFNDTSSFYQPTQGDVRFREDEIIDEYPINKTYENLKTDFDSPQKNAIYQQILQ